MLPLSLGLLLGICLLHQSTLLPAGKLLLIMLCCALPLMRWRTGRPIAAVLLGFAWAGLYAHWHHPQEIPELDTRAVYLASGVVRTLPEIGSGRARLQFLVDSLDIRGKQIGGEWLLRVTWQEPEKVSVGQRWQLPLRIRPVQGFRNPGSWDYAGWLYRQGIRYTAYVTKGEPGRLAEPDCCLLERIREWMRERLLSALPEGKGRGMLLALTLGDRSEVGPTDKEVLALTGTSHLFAISGLHIGLSAVAFGGLITWGWRRTPVLCRRVPAIVAGTVAGLCVAVIYALVSGLGVPAQRALVMFATGAWIVVRREQTVPAQLWATALIAVLFWDPFAPLSAGFWLSFMAVAAIMLLMPTIKGRHWVVQAVILQVGIAEALYPVLLLFGMPGSLVGPLVNLLLVPLFGLLIVPVSLLGVLLAVVSPELGFLAMVVTGLLADIQQVLMLLTEIAPTLPGVKWDWARWALMIVAALLLLAPPGIPLRLLGLVLLVTAHLPSSARLMQGEFEMTLLDVGQGLSAVLRTSNHVLVYDTGARYRTGFNLADVVVLPYLRHQGISHIDMLVLSHGDNDHAGGAEHLVAGLKIHAIREGEPWRNPVKGTLCRAGESWQWDGVRFSFLQQNGSLARKGNNASCVLQVESAAGKLLIPGDIGAAVEKRLLVRLEAEAPYDVVVAPHHGSLTSSSKGFVAAASAAHVLFAVGPNNRYGFPKQQVTQRWQLAGAKGWRTDRDGAITFRFRFNDMPLQPDTYHRSDERYWHLAQRTEVGL